MILLVDKKRASMFTFFKGAVGDKIDISDEQVPQRVKKGGERWNAQDKIFRHIEQHLHRHLAVIGNKAALFAKQNDVSNLVIGSHPFLFKKIKKHLPYPLRNNVRGIFVTELKEPFNKILKRVKYCIEGGEKVKDFSLDKEKMRKLEVKN